MVDDDKIVSCDGQIWNQIVVVKCIFVDRDHLSYFPVPTTQVCQVSGLLFLHCHWAVMLIC